MRPDDVLDVSFRRTRKEVGHPYDLEVGDQVRVEIRGEPDITREVEVQSDGAIVLPLVGAVRANRLTIEQLRQRLQEEYAKFLPQREITVTATKTNVRLQDLLDSVDRRYGQGGLVQEVRVTPDGTIALPAVGSVMVQGMSLAELRLELFHRFSEIVEGIDVQPILRNRAPRYVFVLGEVQRPGRFELEGPTNVMQSIALAGGITAASTGKLKHVVVFRRGPDWQMMATKIDIRGPIVSGRINCGRIDELWLADSDVVLVPKSEVLVLDEYLELLFTRGLYSVVPLTVNINFAKLSTL